MATDAKRTLFGRLLGETALSRLGTLLIAGGLSAFAYAWAWELGLAPGSRVEVPPPIALQRTTERPAPPAAAAEEQPPAAISQPHVLAEPAIDPAIAPAVIVPSEPADTSDRREAAARPLPGEATRLTIPSIDLDTEVVQAGLVPTANGEFEWETVPFVAAHYGGFTAHVGALGNAVISGHVVTINEGNVFRNLYLADLGERIYVYTGNARFTYEIDDVQLVAPSAVEVVAPADEPRLTLITCGGTFDPRTRLFSDRLIVGGHLVAGERLNVES